MSDDMISEIRERHVAAGDPGDPHCAWCSGPDYPIWPCDVAVLLARVAELEAAITESLSEYAQLRPESAMGALEDVMAGKLARDRAAALAGEGQG